MPNFTELEKEVESILSKSSVKTELAHARSARKWLLKLKPDADKALEIAALAHDIERGFEPNYDLKTQEKWSNYDEHKRIHSEKSANVISELLKKHGFDKKFIEKVKRLVLKHEVGGDEESDLVMDADSLSFFEENLVQYFEKYGEEKTRKKIKYMYQRMTEKAKKFLEDFKYNSPVLNKILEEELQNGKSEDH